MIAKGCEWLLLLSVSITCLFLIITVFFEYVLILSIISSSILIFFIIFFRDPPRDIGNGLVAPADGRIREIHTNNGILLISTFMNVHNVHVNRIPLDGTIIHIKHDPGTHIGAWKKEAEENEKLTLKINSEIGDFTLVQRAGCIARRIYPYIKDHDILKKGDKIGIIRFGSRVDVYLPADKIKKVTVKKGDRVYAGVSRIAEI